MTESKNLLSLDIDTFYKVLCKLEPGNLLINYDSELSINTFKALRTIHGYMPHCPVQAIGKSLNITKSGATRCINRLEEYGLIKKCISPNDGRVCCVVLSDKGLKVHNDASEYCKSEMLKILSGLNKETKSCMINALKSTDYI
ncbi:MAG: MarR family transcriptional regulator [bacterium]|nr:MarR family transcriptional regulator [bacterium]